MAAYHCTGFCFVKVFRKLQLIYSQTKPLNKCQTQQESSKKNKKKNKKFTEDKSFEASLRI